MHSIKYTTFLLVQLVCFGVGKDLWLWDEDTLCFFDMTGQHLHPAMSQHADCPSKLGVVVLQSRSSYQKTHFIG